MSHFYGFETIKDNRDSLFYLLSAQAQTLGAILALIFTVTLIMAQLATRYSHLLMGRILGPWAFWYAVPFGIAILLPLFLLNGNFFLWSARLTLLLGGACLLLLIPYFVAVRNLLSIPRVIAEIEENLSNIGSEEDIRASIKSIANIGMGALNLRDYETFDHCVTRLSAIAQADSNDITKSVIIGEEIRDLAFRVGEDRASIEELVANLIELTINVAGRQNQSLQVRKLLGCLADAHETIQPLLLRKGEEGIEAIKKIGIEALTNGEIEVARECQRFFHAIVARGLSSVYVEIDGANVMISALGDLALHNLSSPKSLVSPSPPILAAVRRLEHIGKLAWNRMQFELQETAETQLSRIKDRANGVNARYGQIADAALSSVRSREGPSAI